MPRHLASVIVLGISTLALAGVARADDPMVPVKGGCFEMGAGAAVDDPKHKACVESFEIDKTEVTNAAWARCVAATKCPDLGKDDWKGGQLNEPDQPASSVSWYEADGYCRWASKRLPSEAEWEYAARGSDGRKYPWGNTLDCAHARYGVYPPDWNCKKEWCDKVTACRGKSPAQTAKVGSYPGGASPFGALDMAGNVAEWVDDWYDAEAYFTPDGKPADDARIWKVVRGGYWFGPADYIEATDRDREKPDAHNRSTGFRCARSARK